MKRSPSYRPPRVLTTALLAALFAVSACTSREAPRPNVLFVVVDTLRADHLSSYGYGWETSPNLDELAEQGALFTNCTAGSSWTMPSMMSMFVGEPSFHTIWRLPDEIPVLPEAFAESGYRTGAFVANSILAEDAGFARGFETYQVRQKHTRQWNAEDVNERVVPFLAAAGDDDRPFFAWVHYLDPHHPYQPPGRHQRFDRTPAEVFDADTRAMIEELLAGLPPARQAALRYSLPALAKDVDAYDGEVASVDQAIGGLVGELERRGLRDDTIVIVLADHGEVLYERLQHPDKRELLVDFRESQGLPIPLSDELHKEHGYWITEELIRTPWIMAGPGITAGRRSDALVSNLDAVETLLALCDLDPLGRSGRDLTAALGAPLDTAVPDADAVTSACTEWRTIKTPDGIKLTVPGKDQAARWGHVPERFDLAADPGERSPAAPSDADAARLERLELARRNDLFGLLTAEMDDATRERLRELGYLR